MKLNMPVRYSSGDVNTNIDLLKKKLLMARQDIVFEYSADGETNWNNIDDLQNNDGTWLTNENITNEQNPINYIRMSFDKGLTWPLKLKVNAGFMEDISFDINMIIQQIIQIFLQI